MHIETVRAALIVAAALALSTLREARADATVFWTPSGFVPPTVVVGPGQNVTITNASGSAAEISFPPNLGSSITLFSGSSLAYTAPAQPGTYNYILGSPGGYGAVIVNIAPMVAITTPTNNASFSGPATFPLQATASDTPDDHVADLAFYLGTGTGTNLIQDISAPPYTTGLTNLTAGTYYLIAIATDSHGWTATNIIVVTVPINLSLPKFQAGQFLFNVTGLTTGKTNVIYASTNLTAWTPVKTNTAAGSPTTVTNLMTTGRWFYRVLQLP